MYRIGKGSNLMKYSVVALSFFMILQFGLGIDLWSAAKMKVEDGIQVITQKGYQVCENVRIEQIKAAGIKFTQESWDGFLQICDRLVLSLGQLTVYADIEARVIFVYGDSTDSQAYYVTF